MAGSGGGGVLILLRGFSGKVVNSKGWEEEAQFNIPVPSTRFPAQHTLDYGW
jgi:hypothetical protein